MSRSSSKRPARGDARCLILTQGRNLALLTTKGALATCHLPVVNSLNRFFLNGPVRQFSSASAARKVLPRLADSLGLVGVAAERRPSPPCVVALSCGLQELGDVRVEPVAPRDAKPRGVAPSPRRATPTRGAASVPFRRAAVAWEALVSAPQAGRRGTVTWTPRERAARRNNGRFLPGVRVPSLASRALGLALSRLADDWHTAYGVRPAPAYAYYVDAERAGTCRATTGRRGKTTVRGRSVEAALRGLAGGSARRRAANSKPRRRSRR